MSWYTDSVRGQGERSYAVEMKMRSESIRIARLNRRQAALERARSEHAAAFSAPLLPGVRGYSRAQLERLQNRIKAQKAWGIKGAML